MAKITRIFAILELFECGPKLIFLTVCVDTVCVDTNEGHERYISHFLLENRSMIVFQIGNDSISWFSTWRNAFPLRKTAIFIKIAPMAFISYLKIDQWAIFKQEMRRNGSSAPDLEYACSGPAGRARWSPGIGHGREICIRHILTHAAIYDWLY